MNYLFQKLQHENFAIVAYILLFICSICLVSEIVEYLLQAGCDIDLQSNSGRTALWKAAANDHRVIVSLLVSQGASVNVQNRVGETILFDRVRKLNNCDVLDDLLLYNVDVNIRDVEGNVALHAAAMAGE